MLIDGLPVVLHLALQGISRFQDLADEQVLLVRPDVHTGVIVLIRCVQR